MLCASGAEAKVGVAAAVNIDARGKAPGQQPRVITLGQTVIFNEEITTDAKGLVQILLLDGTTFTVGPNSQLTIDEFVYDPDSGDAKVVASLTKGAFRFIGAQHQPASPAARPSRRRSARSASAAQWSRAASPRRARRCFR